MALSYHVIYLYLSIVLMEIIRCNLYVVVKVYTYKQCMFYVFWEPQCHPNSESDGKHFDSPCASTSSVHK